MNPILTENLNQIKELCEQYEVKSLFAFGSVCTPEFNEDSDIDLLISISQLDYGSYADTYFELAEKFEGLLKRPVDLVTDKLLSNPYFIESINKNKTLLYGN